MNEKKVLVKLAGAIVLLAVLAVSACVEGKEAEDTQDVVVTGQTTEDRGGYNGQIIAGLTVTGQATEYRSGDDGTHQAGLSFDYTDNGDGTVTDNNTGLMWAADGNSAGCNNGNNLNWNDAIDWANELNFAGYTDWRLPNMKELFSLVKFEESAPYIDSTYFPNTGNIYWTSTTYAPHTGGAMNVSFSYGSVDPSPKANGYRVRAVRGGP